MNRTVVAMICVAGFIAAAIGPADAHSKHNQPHTAPQQAEHTGEESTPLESPKAIELSSMTEPQAHNHDAARDEHAKSFATRVMSWLGSFHPAAVHLPIGLLLGALLAEALFMYTGNMTYGAAGRFCVWTGAVGALAAMTFGWLNAGFSLTAHEPFLTTHRWIGTLAGLWAFPVLALNPKSDDSQRRWLYRAALFIGAVLVSVNGFYGGLMIHGAGHHAF